MKTCGKCRILKPKSEFGKHVSTRDGLRWDCKKCNLKPPRKAVCTRCGNGWDHRGNGSLPRLCPACEEQWAWCSGCEVSKPRPDFAKHTPGRKGLQSKCRACIAARNALPEVKARHRANQMKRDYGITREEFDRRAAEQNQRCALCGRDRELIVDHDHGTGRIRGLICFGCNTGLGKLDDSPDGVNRAEVYLWQHRDVLAELAAGMHSAADLIGVK